MALAGESAGARAGDARARRRARGVCALAARVPRATGPRPVPLDRRLRPARGREAAGRAVLRAGRALLRARAAGRHPGRGRRGGRALATAGRERRGHARAAADRGRGGALGGRRADIQRAQPAPGRAVPGDPRRGSGRRATGACTTARRGRRDRGHSRRRRLRAGDARPRGLRLGREHDRRLRLDQPRRDRDLLPDPGRRPARSRDPDRLAARLVPARPARARLAPLAAWVPDALRDRPGARPPCLARAHPLAEARVFAYYDHPILGRPHGKVVVVRFRRPTWVAGAVFYRRFAARRPRPRLCAG